MLEIYDFTVDYRKNPLGIDNKTPFFAWKLKSDGNGVYQKKFNIQIYERQTMQKLWGMELNSGEMGIIYGGKSLQSVTAYIVYIDVEDTRGEKASLLNGNEFVTGFFSKEEWRAKWIGPSVQKESCPILQKKVNIIKNVKSAYACVSAMGLYEIYIDDKKQGKKVLAPGWSSYNETMFYQMYDLKNSISEGEHYVQIMLGKGWYCGNLTWNQKPNLYGDKIGCLFQLEIIYEDNKKEVIVSDESWRWKESFITCSQLFDGEYQDLRRLKTTFREDSEDTAVEIPFTGKKVKASVSDGICEYERIIPKEILYTPNGYTVIDMGQNMAGWLRMRLKGESGQKVHLRFAEVLDQNGNVYFGNLRSAKQEAVYILDDGENILCEHFTYHGYRYVQIEECPCGININDLEGIVLCTKMEEVLKFTCDNELVNRFVENVKWSQKANFISVPTDCPQRDERMGWTGDAQIFIPASCYNYQCASFWSEWFQSLRDDQFENGAFPFVVPNVLPEDWDCLEDWSHINTSAGWGDAGILCPWTLYKFYGDRRILEENYRSMKNYIRYIRYGGKDELVWDWGPQLGDWLALDNGEGSYYGATNIVYTATAYYAKSVGILSKIAKILNIEEDVKVYSALYQRIVERFRRDWIEDNIIRENTQTAQAIAITFGLLTEDQKEHASDKLLGLLEKNHGLLNTGFMGTPEICKALSETGKIKEAEDLFLQTKYPSWLYQVTKGATTIWEHWDGIKENGEFWDDEMNSFNHYSYGSVEEWLIRYVAGIGQTEDSAGFSKIKIEPHLESRFECLDCTYESIRGKIRCAWKKENETINLHIEIPCNTDAVLCLKGRIINLEPGVYQMCVQ